MADCPIPANGDRVRVTRLDNCGRPVEGPDNAFVDACIASVSASPQYEEGTDILRRGMSGNLCGFKPACPSLLGYTTTLSLLHASGELYELLTGQTPILDFEGNVIGWSDCDVKCDSGFGLELWQEVIGIPCPEDAEGLWLYWLYPWITQGRQEGDVEIGDGEFTFTIQGRTRQDSGWSLGPWDVMTNAGEPPEPGPLLTPIGEDCNEWRRVFVTTVAPPEAACEYIVVPPNNTPIAE